MANKFRLEVKTPSSNFYSGYAEQVIVTTPVGTEGIMANHSWTCKLLEAGKLRIKEWGSAEDEWRTASAAGGFMDIKDVVVIYLDAVEWDKGSEEMRRSRRASELTEHRRRSANV